MFNLFKLLIFALLLTASCVTKAESVKQLINQIALKYQTEPAETVFIDLPEKTKEVSEIPVGEELFLSLFFEKQYLGELFGVKTANGVSFELLSFVETLGFAIQVDGTSAKGWFYNEQNYFQITQQSASLFDVAIGEQKYQITSPNINENNEYLYIDSKLLEQWFGLQLRLDYRLLRVYLSTKNKVPTIEKINRSAKKVKQYSNKQGSVMPWKESPYKAISSPVADVQLNVQQDNENTRASYSVLGAFDLAYSNFEYFLSGDNNDLLTDSRLTFKRESTQAELFGPLNATNVSFGDVIASKVGINQGGDYSRGLQFSNAPLFQQKESNKVTISGPVQNDWDVELYRNGLLLAQQNSITDGRYLFENVELLFGTNDFELILYGPQGQVERKQEQFVVDGTSLAKGASVYDFSVSQLGHRLVDSRDDFDREKGWLINGRYEYGITENISIRTGISHFAAEKEAEEDTRYAIGADIKLFNNWLANFDYEKNTFQEEDASFTIRGEALSQSIRASASRRKQANKLTGERVTQNQFQIDAQGDFSLESLGSLSYQNTLNYDEFSGLERATFRNLLSYRYGGLSISNNFEFSKNFSDDSIFSLGSARLQQRFGRLYSRFTVNYQVKPDWEINSYEAELSRSFADAWQAELTYRDLPLLDKYETELGLSWQNEKLNLTANAKYDSDEDWRVGMFMRFSMGYGVDSNAYFMSKRNIAQSGTVMVKVFHDMNNNGRFDEGELPLENVKVKALQSYRNNVTDENGVAVLAGLSNNQKTDIIVDTASITKGFMISAIDGVAITPRSGFAEYIEFPVVNSSELDGTVYVAKESSDDVAPYATVNLIDEKGQVVDQVKAEYDGYYVFTDIKPGEYDIQVENSFSDNKGLKEKHSTKVRLSSKGDVLSEVNMTLVEKTLSSGFVMGLGEFTSHQLMTVYANLIKKQVSTYTKDDIFYIKRNGRFILASGFSENNKESFEESCLKINEVGLDCQVIDVEIKH